MISTENSQSIFQKIYRRLTTPCIGAVYVVGGLCMMFVYVTTSIVQLNCPELLNTVTDYYKAVSDFSTLCLMSMFLTAWYYREKSMSKRYISDVKVWKEFYREHSGEVTD